ncbi:MAG TPA: tyrosine-type recombinase/integrase [Bacteroidia bacterium]|nr:tyrosine-type recombinase/integrase [Bacteroidia bacterium]
MVKKKNKMTECSGMEWKDFLSLVEELKRDKEYLFSLLIALGCYCGLRISDILSITWEDLIEAETLLIQEKKTAKVRNVTLNPALCELIMYVYSKLKNYEKINADTDFVFINRQGSKLTLQYVNRKLHTIFAEHNVKVKNGSSHTLRKTFGKRVYEVNNKSESALVLLSQIFKHSSTAVTRRYIGLQNEEIENAYLNL